MLHMSLALAAFPDLLTAPPVAAPTADAAVVIGLEDYGFLPDVPFAQRDAMAVRTLMVTRLGVAPDRVRLLTTGNREQMLAAVKDAAAQVGPGGKLVVWFSGHGATSPVDGSLLLVGDDAKPQPDAFASRSLSVAELQPLLPADTLLVVDACAAGQARGGEELLPGARFAVPSWAVEAGGLRIWSAAAPTQLAEPYPAARHGLFTALAVGALRGWGDEDGDGLVGLQEAHHWVGRAMAAVGARQTPQLSGPDLIVAPGAEPGPALADLPRLDAPGPRPAGNVLGQLAGKLEGLAPKPAPEKPPEPTFRGPYQRREGGGFEDADGQTLYLGHLAKAEKSPELDRLLGRRAGNIVTVAVGSGVALAGFAGWSTNRAFSDTFGSSSTSSTMSWTYGTVAAGGVAMVTAGTVGLVRKKTRLIEVVNAPYEAQTAD